MSDQKKLISNKQVRFSIVFALGAVLFVMSFQNCGKLQPQATVMASQAEIEFRMMKDKAILDAVMNSPDLRIWTEVDRESIQGGAANIESISGFSPDLVVLDRPSQTGIGPAFSKSKTLGKQILRFANGGRLISRTQLSSNQYTVIALFDSRPSGRVFSLANGSLQVQGLEIGVTGSDFTATAHTGSTSRVSISGRAQVSSGPVILAVAFGSELSDVTMMINGQTVSSQLTSTGNPAAITSLARQLEISSESGSTVRLAELVVLTTKLSRGEMNAISRYMAAKWNFAGVTYEPSDDSSGFVPEPVLQSGAKLYELHCARCHGGLVSSSKRGRTVAQISQAIVSVPSMNSLQSLSSAERERIATALK